MGSIVCGANSICSVLWCCSGLYSSGRTVHEGDSSKGSEKDYSIKGDTENRVFGILNAVAIVATTYGNGIIPEIQATLAPPVKGKMFKGLCVCYAVLIVTFFSVAISGYWAFGNEASSLILTNFVDNGNPLVPMWFIYITNIFTIAQLSAVGVVYVQPTNEVLEQTFGDPKSRVLLTQCDPQVDFKVTCYSYCNYYSSNASPLSMLL